MWCSTSTTVNLKQKSSYEKLVPVANDSSNGCSNETRMCDVE